MNGIQLHSVFPDEYRAFAWGAISALVERYGGIDALARIDIVEHRGKLFPDRSQTRIFSRNNQSMGRPLGTSALRCMLREKSGRMNYFSAENAELFPFGFRTANFDLLLADELVSLRLRPAADGDAVLVISKLHLMCGEFTSDRDQWVGHPEPDECDPDDPKFSSKLHLSWRKPELDGDVLYFDGMQDYEDLLSPLVMAVAAPPHAGLVEDAYQWELSAPVRAGESVAFGIGFGKNRAAALANARRDPEKAWNEALECAASAVAAAPKLHVSGMPTAAEFARVAPMFQRSLRLAETDSEVCVRAASYKYSFFAMWDHIYSYRDYLNGPENLPVARKVLRYMLNFPHIKYCPWVVTHLPQALDEYRAYDDDPAFTAEMFAYFKKYLDCVRKRIHPETGLILSDMNVGVDKPGEVGLDRYFYPACINAWHYNACRVLENLALETGDDALAAETGAIARKIEACYLKLFYNSDAGYLRTAVTRELTNPKLEIYHNTITIGFDYLYGEYLMRRVVGPLANFQATRLFHPLGHTAVPYNSPIPCDMWKGVHMNQHLGHEARLARLAGRADETFRTMAGYLVQYDRYKNALESTNLTGFPGNNSQTGNWQNFSAISALAGLFHGLGGVEAHRGGVIYVPAADDHEIAVDNWIVRGVSHKIRVSGSGAFVGSFRCDGVEIVGTMQIPADVKAGNKRTVEIVRSTEPFAGPVLLSAFNLPVTGVEARDGKLEFTAAGPRIHASIKLWSPKAPRVVCGGAEIPCEYDSNTRIAWIDRVCAPGDRFEIYGC